MMNMTRRGFLGAMLAACAAPAIVKADNIMKVFVPPESGIILWGDGMHDDTTALQAWFNGGRVVRPGGALVSSELSGGYYLISDTIHLKTVHDKRFTNAVVQMNTSDDRYFINVEKMEKTTIYNNLFTRGK